MLDVRRLSLLREVALTGSITAAARSLGLSTPTVSQQLSRLEQETGVALLEPAGRGVQLTPIAVELVQHTERVLEELEAAEATLLTGRDGLGGAIRVAGFSTFASGLLPRVITRLREQHPALVVEFVQLDPEAAMDELAARRADLMLADEYPGFPLRPGRGLVRTLIAREAIRLYPPAGTGPEVSVEDLAAMPWVTEPRTSEAFQWARTVCRGLGFEATVRFESPELHVHRRLVETGLAAAFLPVHLAEGAGVPLLAARGLPEDLHRTVYAVTRRGAELRPGVRACLSAIREAAADPLAGLG